MFSINLLFFHGLLAIASACVDFSDFTAGDVVSNLGNGVRVEALIKPRKFRKDLFPAQAMIFNSSMPTGDDFDLGSPNQDFGGPGIGVGGEMTSSFANKVPQGNVLIISEDEDKSDPDDSKNGGRLKFFFDPPRYIDSIGFLDVESDVRVKVYSANGGRTQIIHDSGRGDNSYQRISIEIPQVHKITIVLQESAAITDVDCQYVPHPACVTSDIAIDFEAYMTGQVVTDLGSGISVSATRHGPKGPVFAEAMIFDSSSPTGGDVDLGTPNESFGGPGVGIGGTAGTSFENLFAQGKILIISEDGDTTDPDDEAAGGVMTFQFTTPTFIKDFGILDNEEGAHVVVTMADGATNEIDIPSFSDNSFETIQVQRADVVMMSFDFEGSAALTHINVSTCV